ncbi:hypothetical protein [Vacuolonema iberomarrocanum]|uniref:hypothetical protein n=1 Tax=Vacuolonema iberomarrocanum TaxID=3454632 RepID=UPI003F6E32C6
MFNFIKRRIAMNTPLSFEALRSKPLLYILDYGESPDERPHMLLQQALEGESDVCVSRAEIDLRKAIEALSLITDSTINSFEALAAMALPRTTAALFWSIQSLLHRHYQNPNLPNAIHDRNHDARLLFQYLAQLNLDPWYEATVHRAALENLPANLQFPSGHPLPGYLYRQHPLKTHQHSYYPVNTYFSLLFEERKQTLLKILEALGATKVVISPIYPEASDRLRDIQPEKIEYTPDSQSISKFEPSQYSWLRYEPIWKSLVYARLKRRFQSIQFELDVDVMGILRTQVQTVAQLISGLNSVLPPDNYKDILAAELLHPVRVEVEFQNS